MSKKNQIVFIIFFCLLLFSVGGIQAIVELKTKGTVQMAEFFIDTFVSPVKRAKELNESAKKLADALNLIVKDKNTESYDMVSAVDNVLGITQSLENCFLNINRYYRADTSENGYSAIVTMKSLLTELYDNANDGAAESLINERCSAALKLAREIEANYREVGAVDRVTLAAGAFATSTFFSAKYLRAYEKAMEEASVFANATRPWMQFVRYAAMNDVGSKAVNGRNNWLYYRQDVDFIVRPDIYDKRAQQVDYNDKKTEDALAAIKIFKNQLEALGVELLVVVVPGKPSIYPDYLSDKFTVADAGKLSHSTRMIKELTSAGVMCVDLFTPFAAERVNDEAAGDPMYLSTDTHWKSRGARLAARIVAERVKQYEWFSELSNAAVEYALDSLTVMRKGDVAVMTKLPDFKVRNLTMDFPAEATLCYQVYSVARDKNGNEVGRRLFRDDYSPNSKILILGDSFSRIYQTDEPRSAGWISHLAYELSQPLASLVSDGGASTLVRETLSRRVVDARKEGRRTILDGKKLVIWEFVERDFRYGAEGWKYVEL